MNEDVLVALSDPEGSGLYNKVCSLIYSVSGARLPFTSFVQIKYGVMFDAKESEGTKRRHQVDTVVEGMYVVLLAVCDRSRL